MKLLPNVQEHLGEVQPPRTARSRTGPRGAPGNVGNVVETKVVGYEVNGL